MIPRPKCGIIDSHCHIASTRFIPRSFLEGSVRNAVTRLQSEGVPADYDKVLDVYLAQMNDHTGDRLIAEMETSGIDRCVLLLPDFSYALPDTALTIAEMFEQHYEILKRHGKRFLVFAGVDPRWGSDGIKLFEKGVAEYGFAGMKLYPPCGYRTSDKALYPFYEICAARHLPVVVHTGGTSPVLLFEPAHPLHVDQAARDFPGVNFILAHGSTVYVHECAMICTFRPNVFLDCSAYESRPLELLREAFTRGVNHKIIFGSDWPVFRLQGDLKECLRNLLDENGPLRELRPREIENFLRKTMERLLPETHRTPSAR